MIIGVILDGVLFVFAHILAARLLRVRGLSAYRFRYEIPRAPWPREVAVRLSGVVAIYLFAVICFAASARVQGTTGTRVRVEPGHPAHVAGVRDGDRIVAVDGAATQYFGTIVERIRALGPNGKLSLTIERQNERHIFEVALGADGRLGVYPDNERIEVPVLDAFAQSFAQPFTALRAAITGFIQATASLETEQVGGPVAVVQGAEQGSNVLQTGVFGAAFFASLAMPLLALYALMLVMIDLVTRRSGQPRARNTENNALGRGSKVP